MPGAVTLTGPVATGRRGLHSWVAKAWRPAMGIADQGFSSLTNFATAVLAARYADPSRFGDLVLALSIAYMTTILARGLTAEPVMTKCPRLVGTALRRAEEDAVAMALLVGVVAGAATASLTMLPTRSTRDFLWVGVCLPAVLVQDVLRYVGFARGRQEAALAADGGWAIVQFGVVGSLIAYHDVSIHWLVAAWGLGAAAGAVAGALALSIRSVGSALRWKRLTSSYSFWVLPQLALSQATDQGTTLVLVTVFGSADLGGIRAVQLFVRPVFVFMLAMQALLVPALTRRLLEQGRAGFFRQAKVLAAWISAVAVVVAIAAVLGGRELSRLVFGPSYVGYARFILPFAVGSVFHACSVLPGAGLRSLQRGKRILLVQVGSSAAALTAVITTAMVSTVYATAWATTVQGLSASLLGWVALGTAHQSSRRRHLPDVRSAADGGPEPRSGRLVTEVP